MIGQPSRSVPAKKKALGFAKYKIRFDMIENITKVTNPFCVGLRPPIIGQ